MSSPGKTKHWQWSWPRLTSSQYRPGIYNHRGHGGHREDYPIISSAPLRVLCGESFITPNKNTAFGSQRYFCYSGRIFQFDPEKLQSLNVFPPARPKIMPSKSSSAQKSYKRDPNYFYKLAQSIEQEFGAGFATNLQIMLGKLKLLLGHKIEF